MSRCCVLLVCITGKASAAEHVLCFLFGGCCYLVFVVCLGFFLLNQFLSLFLTLHFVFQCFTNIQKTRRCRWSKIIWEKAERLHYLCYRYFKTLSYILYGHRGQKEFRLSVILNFFFITTSLYGALNDFKMML